MLNLVRHAFSQWKHSLVGDSKCGRKYRQTAQTASMKLEIDGINGFIPLPSEEELEVDRICEQMSRKRGVKSLELIGRLLQYLNPGHDVVNL